MLITSLIAGTGTVFGAATPAQAKIHGSTATRVSWSYTDSAASSESFDVGTLHPVAVPLGAWRGNDGKHHLSRMYLTFDLSGVTGQKIYDAKVFLTEKTVADCAKRTIDVWSTSAATTAPTWQNAPTEISLLASERSSGGVCPRIVGFDVADAVRSAVAAGDQTFSIELRVPEEYEGDVAYGRGIDETGSSVQLYLGSNTLPAVDSSRMYTGPRACDRQQPGTLVAGASPLFIKLTDPDEGDRISLEGDWAIWPVLQPEQRTVLSGPATRVVSSLTPPASLFADGQTYAWQARTNDGTDVSSWSEICYFTVDLQSPDAVPGVTSSQFPKGQGVPGGTPGVFTFTAGGVEDVAGYQYSWGDLGTPGVYWLDDEGAPVWQEPLDLPGYVRATALGGQASVTLSPPRTSNVLQVRSLDRAGHAGPTTRYEVYVSNTAPTLSVNGKTSWGAYQIDYGQSAAIRLTPHPDLHDVIGYSYQINSGPVVDISANADGTADLTYTPNGTASTDLQVWSRSANGWRSPSTSAWMTVTTAPKVTSDVYPEDADLNPLGGVGITGTFTFAPRLPDVVAYRYSFDWGVETVVPAGADGTASITWTPMTADYHAITVVSVRADGTDSDYTEYYINVP